MIKKIKTTCPFGINSTLDMPVYNTMHSPSVADPFVSIYTLDPDAKVVLKGGGGEVQGWRSGEGGIICGP